jgi:hypothetical protein
MEMLSYKQNQMYLYGEVGADDKVVTQHKYINLTVEALKPGS